MSENHTGRVLVADSDLSSKMLMATTLESHGFIVVLASSGIDVLRKFRENSFDVVIIDLTLPEIDGLGICEWIRGQFGSDVSIVVTAKRAEPQLVRQIFNLGVADLIIKPVISWQLIGCKVKYIFNSHQMRLAFNASEARNRTLLQGFRDT